MDHIRAYRWLHGDRIEFSGCREAAEALMQRIRLLEAQLGECGNPPQSNSGKPTVALSDAAFNVASHKVMGDLS